MRRAPLAWTLDSCDAKWDTQTAIACGQRFAQEGVAGVLNFQIDQPDSAQVCAAYNDLPTIAIDILQPPCQVAFMGANNRLAGRLGGEAMGAFAKDHWDCDYTAYLSLDTVLPAAADSDRMGGYRDGFREFCPILHEHVIAPADSGSVAQEAVAELLPRIQGSRIVVVAINEDAIQGAIHAATILKRRGDLFYSGQGADPTMWQEIACDPQYVASVGFFPERYGQILIPAMIDILRGKKVTADGADGTVPADLYTQHEVITKDNIRTIYPATPEC